LLKLLEGLDENDDQQQNQQKSSPSFQNAGQDQDGNNGNAKLGIGMDSCIIPLRRNGLFLVQTTDFFYPLVDDPYMMGKIACANVLSDLYATGVWDCDNMLMLLAVSNQLSDKERDVIIPLLIRGFKDCASEAGTSVQGGQTVINPWVIIGGVATTVCSPSEFLMPDGALVGDVLLLTKPLGTQIAVLAHQWVEQKPDRYAKIRHVVGVDEVKRAYERAMFSMARLNRTAARLMHKYNAHAATDVTGFGILGHAQNMARVQKNAVSFVIHNLPIINHVATVAKTCGMQSLFQGVSPETSGGLLIALPREQAVAFCKEIEKVDGFPAWIIGIVERGDRTARINDKPRIIDVPSKDIPDQLW